MPRGKTLRPHRAGLQPVQVLAGLVGLVLLVFGIVGLVMTGFGDFTGHQHGSLLGIAVNPFHNIVHILTGVLGVLCATASGLARTFGWILFAAYGVVLVWGLMITGVIASNPVSGLGDPLNLTPAANGLHAGLALAGLLIAVMPARKVVHTGELDPVTPDTTVDSTRGNRLDGTGETTATQPPVTDKTARVEPATGPIAAPGRRWDLRTR